MANCPVCFVDSCIDSIACEPYSAGGWVAVYFTNACDVSSKSFAAAGGDPMALLDNFTLKSGKALFTAKFNKSTGMQLDSAMTKPGGYIWTHTMTMDFSQFSPEALSALEKHLGSEIFVIAEDRKGKFWCFGIGTEGLQITTWNFAHGRLGTDNKIHTPTWTLSDGFRPHELQYYTANPGDPTDIYQKTKDFLDSLVNCNLSA